jgi:peroxiredoxin
MIVATRVRRAAAVVATALLTPGLGQRPALGEPAPSVPLVDLDGNRRAVSDLSGARGLVILFWANWSERSLTELTRLNESAGALREHGVTLVAVNVEHQSPSASDLAAVRTSVATLGLTIPVLVDDGLELFKAYGVITVPSTALVDPAGKLVHFAAGYAPGSREALFDAVDVLAGQQKATPAVVSRAAVPASALRKLQAGRLELANRRVEAARATFAALVESEPSFVEPIVELAALAIDDRDLTDADRLLARAFALQPDHGEATREQARARFVGGQTADAVAALQRICALGDDPLADGYLGLVLAGTGRVEEATEWFERSRAAGLDARRFLIDAGDENVAAAMAAYRRAAARRVIGIK